MRIRQYHGWQIVIARIPWARHGKEAWEARAQRGDVARGYVTPRLRHAWRGILRLVDEVRDA